MARCIIHGCNEPAVGEALWEYAREDPRCVQHAIEIVTRQIIRLSAYQGMLYRYRDATGKVD